jgi:hypothetical protein
MANDGSLYARAGGTAEFRKSTRLAINLRDHLACINCLKDLTTAAPDQITLDHLLTACEYYRLSEDERTAFGSLNQPSNVVTACRDCNLARNKQAWTEFYSDDAQARIAVQVALPLNRALALAIISGKVGDPKLDGSIA